MKGKLKPIMDLIIEKRRRERGVLESAKGLLKNNDPHLQHTVPKFELSERPLTSNLLKREISSAADVTEALDKVRDAEQKMKQIRQHTHHIGAVANKYSAVETTSPKAEILFINH